MKRSDLKKSLQTIKKNLDASTAQAYPTMDENPEPLKDYCHCKDSNGEVKTLYTTRKEAEMASEMLAVTLTIYPCPVENGWHLTKS